VYATLKTQENEIKNAMKYMVLLFLIKGIRLGKQTKEVTIKGKKNKAVLPPGLGVFNIIHCITATKAVNTNAEEDTKTGVLRDESLFLSFVNLKKI